MLQRGLTFPDLTVILSPLKVTSVSTENVTQSSWSLSWPFFWHGEEWDGGTSCIRLFKDTGVGLVTKP